MNGGERFIPQNNPNHVELSPRLMEQLHDVQQAREYIGAMHESDTTPQLATRYTHFFESLYGKTKESKGHILLPYTPVNITVAKLPVAKAIIYDLFSNILDSLDLSKANLDTVHEQRLKPKNITTAICYFGLDGKTRSSKEATDQEVGFRVHPQLYGTIERLRSKPEYIKKYRDAELIK